ncbi:Hfi Hydroxypyruvate isomerase [Rhabdaerophilaceae bacterium]
MPRFSANLGFLWPDRPLLERIDAAAAAGFRAIELHWPFDIPPEAVRERCVHRDLAILGLNTPTGERAGDFGLAALPGREQDFAAAFDEALAYAASIGAKAVHVMAGVVQAPFRDEARAVFLTNLRRVAPLAERFGVTILLEPINRRDRPDYFYDRIDEAAEIIRAVGSPVVKIMFDCYHVGITEGDVIRRLADHLPLVGHIQFAAVPDRSEPDRGDLDYQAVFVAIDSLGYAGWVGAEYKPRGDTDSGLAWLAKSSPA